MKVRMKRRDLLVFLWLACSFSVSGAQRYAAGPPRLMTGLGHHHHPISTHSSLAQRFFDQGLTLLFAFNQDEAISSFRRAADLDAGSAMPLWGIAVAMGPNINMDMDPGRQRMAYEFVQKALLLRSGMSNKEREYVEALAKRYSPDQSRDVGALARDYANAMRQLSQRYPRDVDAATLYAESLMDLHPWQLWGFDGNPVGETEEIIKVLQSVLKRDPNHIGANHYYIHAVEASKHPERALKSARLLERLAPALGHIVHMPSHVYMRIGDYSAAARSDEAAADADRCYLTRAKKWGSTYDMMYYTHNLHSLVAAYSMAGRLADTERAALDLVTHAGSLLPQMPDAEFYLSTELFVFLRFNKWDQIMATPQPPEGQLMTTAFWHLARGIAASRKGLTATAEKERQSLQDSHQYVPADLDFGGYFNKAGKFLDLAIAILDARIAWAKDDRAGAIEHWRNATEIEDSFTYSEPPDWYYPVRESLGAALLQCGRSLEAERVFRADLERNPGNPRSLFGLWRSLVIQKNTSAAKEVRKEYVTAWRLADIRLGLEDF